MASDVSAPELLVKQPGEKRRYAMDFAALLATDEVIANPTVTSELIGGGTSDLTITGVTISGSLTLMWISGGQHNQNYRIDCLVDTSSGAILEGDGRLKISRK